jgi:hypothetical protein
LKANETLEPGREPDGAADFTAFGIYRPM